MFKCFPAFSYPFPAFKMSCIRNVGSALGTSGLLHCKSLHNDLERGLLFKPDDLHLNSSFDIPTSGQVKLFAFSVLICKMEIIHLTMLL